MTLSEIEAELEKVGEEASWDWGSDGTFLKSFLLEQLKKREEEVRREKVGMNLGFIRQYLGEVPKDTIFTADELWKVFNTFAPLMTKEQEKELVEALKSIEKRV